MKPNCPADQKTRGLESADPEDDNFSTFYFLP